jgi:hypothetical protein
MLFSSVLIILLLLTTSLLLVYLCHFVLSILKDGEVVRMTERERGSEDD